MADPKPTPSKKVFDVSKPKADATSKPVIVGHKPLIGDPMVTDKQPISTLSETDVHDPKDTGETGLIEGEAEATETKIKTANTRLKPSVGLVSEVENAKKGIVEDKEVLKSSMQTSSDASSESVDGSGAVDAVLGEAKGVKEAELIENERIEAAEQLAATGKYKVQISGSAKHHHHKKGKKGGSGSMLKILLLLIIVAGAGGYAAIDSGYFKTNIKLPYHFFKQKVETVAETPVVPKPKTSTNVTPINTTTKTSSTIPDTFQQYKMVDAGIGFAYPKEWGNVIVIPEKGYTKRDNSAPKSDGVFAYIATFSKNANVELAVTSNKYLPVKRTPPNYYDYLNWCTTSAGSLKNQILNYKTVAGVDQVDAITCDQVLGGTATKLEEKTLIQTKVKTASGTVVGDIYTRNLDTTSDLIALHIKDITLTNTNNIKTLLANVVQLGTSSSSSN